MNRRRRRINPLFVVSILLLIGAGVYVDTVIIPTTPPLFIPTQTPTREPRAYVAEAETLLNDGKLIPAIDSYKLASQVDPQNINVYLSLARLQIYAGNYQDAAANAENAILLNKSNALAHALRGWALAYQDDFLRAEAAIKTALEIDPNNASAHAIYAFLLARQIESDQQALGTVDKAIEESKTALNLDSNLFEVRWARGYVLEVTGNSEEAVGEYEAAVQLDTNIGAVHLALGRGYFAQGETDETMYVKAVEEFERAYSLDPTNPEPNVWISQIYGKLGEFTKAIQYAEQAVKDGPDDPVLYGNLGTWYYRSGDFEGALKPLTLAVRGGSAEDGTAVQGLPLDDTERVIGYYSRYGLTLARLNQCNEAIQISSAMLQSVGDNETAAYNADQMVVICQENIYGTATPTREPKITDTPQP